MIVIKSQMELNRIFILKFFYILFTVLILFLSRNLVFANVFDNKVYLESIINQLPEVKSIKCKFSQEKILPNIEKPLISSGDFEFIENKGVYFYTYYPVKSTIDYTNKNYKQINDIINALSSKKYKRIEKEFDFYFEKKDKKKILGLKPKNEAAQFIDFILIEGDNSIQKIKIQMVNGATTNILFTN